MTTLLRVLRILLLLYVAVILQGTLAPAIGIARVQPDFPFLIVLLVALREGAAGGALAGFVAGLFIDLASAQHLGVSSLVNSLVAFGVGSISDRIVRDSMVTRAVVVLIAVAIRDQCVASVTLAEGFVDGVRLIATFSVPGGLYSALFAAPVMALADRFIVWEKEKKRAVR
ncbi:rod shape-determining protein MreD [bacterium]|nr:rod shape-determining protein MreD [bacterium]